MIDLSICITANNESKTISNIISDYSSMCKLLNVDVEFIILDNGSTDNTYFISKETAKFDRCILLRSSVMLPYVKAYNLILTLARGKYIFVTDADGQYEPIDFLQLWNLREKAWIITGIKIHREDPFFKVFQSKMFHTVVGIIMGKQFKDPDCGFRLINRYVYDDIETLYIMPYSPGTEMLYRANAYGMKIMEVPVRHYKRKYGKSKITNISKLLDLIKEQTLGLARLRVKLL